MYAYIYTSFNTPETVDAEAAAPEQDDFSFSPPPEEFISDHLSDYEETRMYI